MWRKLGVILRKDDIVSDFLEKKSSQRWDLNNPSHSKTTFYTLTF
jgi:hypothetical protein